MAIKKWGSMEKMEAEQERRKQQNLKLESRMEEEKRHFWDREEIFGPLKNFMVNIELPAERVSSYFKEKIDNTQGELKPWGQGQGSGNQGETGWEVYRRRGKRGLDPGGVLPSNGLMGMCCWMGSHFHDWIDYNGVAFSLEANRVTIMGSHICGISGVSKFRQVGIWGIFAQK